MALLAPEAVKKSLLEKATRKRRKKRHVAWILANEHVCPAPPGLMILIICILSPWGSGFIPYLLHPFGAKLLAC